jgi:hypothetical protein
VLSTRCLPTGEQVGQPLDQGLGHWSDALFDSVFKEKKLRDKIAAAQQTVAAQQAVLQQSQTPAPGYDVSRLPEARSSYLAFVLGGLALVLLLKRS